MKHISSNMYASNNFEPASNVVFYGIIAGFVLYAFIFVLAMIMVIRMNQNKTYNIERRLKVARPLAIVSVFIIIFVVLFC